MLTPSKVLDLYFLEARCMLIEVAATLDRFDRAVDSDSNGDGGDARIEKLYESLQVLSSKSETSDRSEQLLKLFSGPA